jgi:hypothetical protein
MVNKKAEALRHLFDILSNPLLSGDTKVARDFLGRWGNSSLPIDALNEMLTEALLQLGIVEISGNASLRPRQRLNILGLENGQEIFIFSDFPVDFFGKEVKKADAVNVYSSSGPAERDTVWPFLDESLKILKEIPEFLAVLPKGAKVLDLCTGAGAIAIGIHKLRPDLDIIGADISEAAILTATQNSFLNNCDPKKISWRRGHLFDAVAQDGPFDLIIADPNFAPKPTDNVPGKSTHGGRHGDILTSEILTKIPAFLSRNDYSTVYFLTYTLGPDNSLKGLKVIKSIPPLFTKQISKAGEKIWRYKYSKAFPNPMRVQYIIIRLGDETSEDSIINLPPEVQIKTIDTWTSWLDGLNDNRLGYLHYVRGILKWQDSQLDD